MTCSHTGRPIAHEEIVQRDKSMFLANQNLPNGTAMGAPGRNGKDSAAREGEKRPIVRSM